MAKTKPELIEELDKTLGYNLVVGLKDGDIPIYCAFCDSNAVEFRINKYRFCEKCWKLFELFIELKNL